jgi:hypothetical protein
VLVPLHEARDEVAEDAAREAALTLREQSFKPELLRPELALRDAQERGERGRAQVRPEPRGRLRVILRRPAGPERAVIIDLAEVHRGEGELVLPARRVLFEREADGL